MSNKLFVVITLLFTFINLPFSVTFNYLKIIHDIYDEIWNLPYSKLLSAQQAVPQDAWHGASAGSGGVSPLAQPHYTAIDTETVLKLTTIKSDAHDVCHLPYLNSNS